MDSPRFLTDPLAKEAARVGRDPAGGVGWPVPGSGPRLDQAAKAGGAWGQYRRAGRGFPS